MSLREFSSIPRAIDYLSPQDPILSQKPRGSGGCINSTYLIELKSGKSFFIKANSSAPSDMFREEARGLLALADNFPLKVPAPLALGKEGSRDFLIMENIRSASESSDFWPNFGHALAQMHKRKGPSVYGFGSDNYIGSTRQINDQLVCWTDFFCEKRLMYQLELASAKKLADAYIIQGVEKICNKIRSLLPEPEYPSLLHGDLWSGNYLTDEEGQAALIDPAVYFGHREADLAMTELFGRFNSIFYSAYNEVYPLEKSYRERKDLYNLYHMLNHLNLFGTSYLGSVKSIISAYL